MYVALGSQDATDPTDNHESYPKLLLDLRTQQTRQERSSCRHRKVKARRLQHCLAALKALSYIGNNISVGIKIMFIVITAWKSKSNGAQIEKAISKHS